MVILSKIRYVLGYNLLTPSKEKIRNLDSMGCFNTLGQDGPTTLPTEETQSWISCGISCKRRCDGERRCFCGV